MLLLLAEYLQQFHTGFGVFQYLTLRFSSASRRSPNRFLCRSI